MVEHEPKYHYASPNMMQRALVYLVNMIRSLQQGPSAQTQPGRARMTFDLNVIPRALGPSTWQVCGLLPGSRIPFSELICVRLLRHNVITRAKLVFLTSSEPQK